MSCCNINLQKLIELYDLQFKSGRHNYHTITTIFIYLCGRFASSTDMYIYADISWYCGQCSTYQVNTSHYVHDHR